MRNAKTVMLLLAVAGLGAYIWFFELRSLSTEERKAMDRQAFDLPVERINRIGLRTPEYEVMMFQTNQGWELEHPKGARAGEAVVRQLLARFRTLSRGVLITPADMRQDGRTLADYGLAVPRVVLTLGTGAERREYRIGDPSPLGNALYVKEEDSQNVMLVSSDLLEILPRNVFAFRDKNLFPMNRSDVRALALITEDRVTRLEKSGGEWWFDDPFSGYAHQDKIPELVEKFLQARLLGVVNDPSSEVLEVFRSREDVIRMWSATSQVPVEIVVGGDVPAEPEACYARLSGQEGLVMVSKGLRILANSQMDTFRDRRVLRAEPDAFSAVDIRTPDEKVRLEKAGDFWKVRTPVERDASLLRVQRMLRTWLDSRVELFLAADPEKKALYSVSFERMVNGGIQADRFDVLEGDIPPGRAWLRAGGDGEILQVVPDLVRFSPVDVLSYLSREMLNFDPDQVVRLSVTRGNEATVVSRVNTQQPWSTGTEGRVVNPLAVEQLLAGLSTLYAEQLVALNPDSLEPYGLDEPTIRVSLGLGGPHPTNHTLLIHDSQSDDRVYALLQGRNLVFELPRSRVEEIQEPIVSGIPDPAPPPNVPANPNE
ncbi:MAG: DUF4340 domain-containing protein [Kiritimatiellia bacterium]